MATQDDLPYTSPARKLIRFFLKSRDQWKAKCQSAKATVKRLENRVRFLEKSKDTWKARTRTLEAENARLKAQVEKLSVQPEMQVEVKKSRSTLSHIPSAKFFRHPQGSFLQPGSDYVLYSSSGIGLHGNALRGEEPEDSPRILSASPVYSILEQQSALAVARGVLQTHPK